MFFGDPLHFRVMCGDEVLRCRWRIDDLNTRLQDTLVSLQDLYGCLNIVICNEGKSVSRIEVRQCLVHTDNILVVLPLHTYSLTLRDKVRCRLSSDEPNQERDDFS